MAETEFVTAKFPDAEVPRTQSRAQTRRRVHRFIPAGSKARIREAGGEFGPWRTERDAVQRLDDRMARMGVGPKLIVQRESDREQLSIREVAVGPAIPELGASPFIEQAHAVIYDEFGPQLLRSAGIWLCRYVDGTTTVSKHGYLDDIPPETWRGAAEDLFVTSGGMTQLKKVARFTVDRAKSKAITLSTVIVDHSIFTAPDFVERPYGGDPHYHQHHDAPGGHPCSP
jgi:hypothetical protein